MSIHRYLKFLNNIYINILFIMLLFEVNCQLKIPFKHYPVYKYDNSTPSTIMKGIIYMKLYTSVELGTPKQSVQLPLQFYSNDFYISDDPTYRYSQEPDRFSNIKLFHKTSSTSLEIIEEKYLNGDNFFFANYDKDIFYFENITKELEFYLPHTLKDVDSGGIGLQLMPYSNSTTSTPNPQRSFLRILKNKNLIKDYFWSIFYNARENNMQDEGFILFGLLPHDSKMKLGYYPNNYFNEKNNKNTNAELYIDIVLNKFKINEIYAFEGNNKEKKIANILFNDSNELNIELDYNSGGIEAPNKVKIYLEEIFKEYISKEECFFDSFNITNIKSFFYCKNNENILSNIKKNFPGFAFKSIDFDYNFIIDFDDLFIKYNNYIFCLLIFDDLNPKEWWIMGKPFVKKYQFTFNPDKKTINFYSLNIEENGNEKNNKNYNIVIYILFSIIILLLLIIIVILIWKYCKNEKILRKKRANELDDDYEYSQKKDIKNENDSNEKLTDEPFE